MNGRTELLVNGVFAGGMMSPVQVIDRFIV